MKLFKTLLDATIGFAIGIVCSFLFYEFVVSELDIDDSYKVIMFGMTATFLSIGYAFSTQIRCLTCLTFPEFCSTAGKRALQATIIILALSGPLANIGRNVDEVVHLVICFKDLTVNITLVGKELLMGPIQHLLYDIKTQEDNSESRYNLTELNYMVEQIDEEIGDEREPELLKEDNDEYDIEFGHPKRSVDVELENQIVEYDDAGERIEKLYRKKLFYRCENIFTIGTAECIKMFEKKEDECYEAVTKYLAWLLCWPLKLTFVCDIIGMVAQSHLCDMTNMVPDGFGENYLTMRKGIDDFSKKFKVKVDYQALAHLVNIDALKGTEEELLAAYERTRRYVEFFLDLVKKLLTFTFLLMIFDALEYQDKYFQRLSFDNCYITSYFLRIDYRRKHFQNRSFILPLKSYERSDFMTVFRLRLKEREATKFLFSLLMLFIQFLVVLIIYGFDYVFTRFLELIRKHSPTNLRQTGHHSIQFSVTGTGFIAKLIRDVVKDVNSAKEVDVSHLTTPCLPDPYRLHTAYIIRTLILFAVLIFIIYFEAFSLRTRHCIANCFYPKRSKARIIWLYNQTLRNRTAKLTHLKERVLQNADELHEKVDWNLLLACAQIFPRFCRCLTFCKAARRKCVLCKEYGEFYRCPVCSFSYCYECYEDVDKRCLYCIANAELRNQMYKEIDDEINNV